MVVPRSHVEAVLRSAGNVLHTQTGGACGFIPGSQATMDAMLGLHEFLPREEMETNERWLQVIPYVVILNHREIVMYRRIKQSGEKRLMGKYSIGFGGHINDGDATFGEAMERELEEEVDFQGSILSPKFRGFLLDSSTAVGRVHIGLVHVAHTHCDSAGIPTSNEPDSIEIKGQVTVEKLKMLRDVDDFPWENWSLMCIDAIDNIVT